MNPGYLKICSKCKKEKLLSEFWKEKKNKNGLGLVARCKDCSKEKYQKYYNNNIEKYKESNRNYYASNYYKWWERSIKVKYKVEPEVIYKMFDEQDASCAICKKFFSATMPHIDHDHDTGIIRGLLCIHCNAQLLNGYEKLPKELQNWEYLNKYLERGKE